MFVACSTRCFSRMPFETALRRIADLEFDKIDLAIDQNGPHIRPCDVVENMDSVLHRIRHGPSLTPAALDLDFGSIDAVNLRKRFEAICRLAKPLTVAVLTIPSAASGTPLESEIERLGALSEIASREGLVLTVATKAGTLAGDAKCAATLCKSIPGLGLTLDPSYCVVSASAFDDLYPYVQNVHLRDTGKKPHEFQVRIGQGKIEYGRIITMLERNGYDRSLTIAILDHLDNPFEVEVETRKLKLLLESLL